MNSIPNTLEVIRAAAMHATLQGIQDAVMTAFPAQSMLRTMSYDDYVASLPCVTLLEDHSDDDTVSDADVEEVVSKKPRKRSK